MVSYLFNKPFNEQVDFLQKKINLPTERWDDVRHAAHDRSFVVAGAQTADLLKDFHAAIQKAASEGKGLEAFRKEFKEIVARHGWTGWRGEGSPAGEAWRTKVIYQTNMAASYSAGRYAQLTHPDLLKVRAYWLYVHSDSVISPRPLHQSWDGLVLPHNHDFWKKHFPINGWGCACEVRAVDKDAFQAAKAAGRGPDAAPAGDDVAGIDEGFQYTPGANVDIPLRDLVEKKLVTYPPAIKQALSQDINQYFAERAADQVKSLLRNEEKQETLGVVVDGEKLSTLLKREIDANWVTMDGKTVRKVMTQPIAPNSPVGTRVPSEADFAHLINLINTPDVMRLLSNEPPSVGFEFKFGGETLTAEFLLEVNNGRTVFALREFLIKKGVA